MKQFLLVNIYSGLVTGHTKNNTSVHKAPETVQKNQAWGTKKMSEAYASPVIFG